MLRLCLAFALALLTSACGDTVTLSTPAELRGEWLVTYPAPNGARNEQRMTFGEDGAYTSETLWYGFYGLPSGELTGYSRSNGQFRVEDGRLEVRIGQASQWQKYAAGPNPTDVVIPAPAWEERGTVRVEGDRLTHTYVSAPLDAPETFTETYQRVR